MVVIGVPAGCLGVRLLLNEDQRLQDFAGGLVLGFKPDFRHTPGNSCHQPLTATDVQPGLLSEIVRHQICVFSNASGPEGIVTLRSSSGNTS